jgi:hypothetical protein
MDHRQFDAVTRDLAGGVGSRRAAARLLAAGALSVLAGRFGATVGRAKQKSRAERQSHGRLQHEGKHKRKHQKHHQSQPEPQPQPQPSPQGCSAACTDSGGRCCAGGSCAPPGSCCPDQRRCDDGSCIARDQCCPGKKPCTDRSCVAIDQCCPNEPAPVCGTCETATCQLGVMGCAPVTQCDHGRSVNPQTCECHCPSGHQILLNGDCCPNNLACVRDPSGHATICCSDDTICVLGQYCS